MTPSDRPVQHYVRAAEGHSTKPAEKPRRRHRAVLWACAVLAAVGVPGAGFLAAQNASAATSLGLVTFNVLKVTGNVWTDSRSAAEFACLQKYPATQDVNYMSAVEIPGTKDYTWLVTYECLG